MRASFVLAAAALLTVGVGACASRPVRGSQDRDALVGTQWRLTGVRSAAGRDAVPAGYDARLGFAAHGRFEGRDGANALAGTYRTSAATLTIHVTTAGGAGTAHTFPALQAMSSVYTPTSGTGGAVTSGYTLEGRTLTLVTAGWTVTFRAVTAQAPGPTPPPSVTASPS